MDAWSVPVKIKQPMTVGLINMAVLNTTLLVAKGRPWPPLLLKDINSLGSC
jgi:hypothetical protein